MRDDACEPLRILQVEEAGAVTSLPVEREGDRDGETRARRSYGARLQVDCRPHTHKLALQHQRQLCLQMLPVSRHTVHHKAQDQIPSAQGEGQIPEPHILDMGHGRPPKTGNCIRHDGNAHKLLLHGDNLLFRRLHQRDTDVPHR